MVNPVSVGFFEILFPNQCSGFIGALFEVNEFPGNLCSCVNGKSRIVFLKPTVRLYRKSLVEGIVLLALEDVNEIGHKQKEATLL